MKKLSKKLVSVVLAVVMVLSMTCTAFAAPEDYTITVHNSVPTKEYSAYKIFDATYNDDGNVAYTIDSGSAWFETIDTSNVFTLTRQNDTTTYTVTVPEGVTEEAIILFLSGCNVPDGAEASATGTGTGRDLTLTVGECGYYFVTTETGSVVSITTNTPTAVIVDKNTTPGNLEKDMVVTSQDGDDHTDSQAIGDNVEFIVKADVPLYDGDNLVTDYEFTDTLTTGLTIELAAKDVTLSSDGKYYLSESVIDEWVTIGSANDENVSLKLSDSRLVGTYYVELTGVQSTASGYTANGFYLYYETWNRVNYDPDIVQTAADIDTGAYPSDATITIDYTAHVNDVAEYDNENDIFMEYHVTPFNSPTPLDPEYGGNFEDYDDVYVAEVDVFKVDGADNSILLPNATFQLNGDNLHDVVVNTTISYNALETYAEYEAALEAGTPLYFLLDDGFYTTVNPYLLPDEDAALANYVKTPNAPDNYKYAAYTQTVSEETEVIPSDENHNVEATTDENGKVTFRGLRSGTYTLTEIKAPNGYNLLPDPIIITINFVTDTEKATGHFEMSAVNSEGVSIGTFSQDTGTFTLTIENNAGSILPGTGGMGTTLFYIIGVILVCGAVVLLVSRRRMHSAE